MPMRTWKFSYPGWGNRLQHLVRKRQLPGPGGQVLAHFLGADWTTRETVARECSNGYYEYADGIRARYVRVTGGELPYGQLLRISGLRVFGNGEGAKPAQAEAAGARVDALDAKITWKHIEKAQGYNVRYGVAPDKLYLSWLVYAADEVTLSTLTAGQEYYVCVDSFNENGITPGKIFKLEG